MKIDGPGKIILKIIILRGTVFYIETTRVEKHLMSFQRFVKFFYVFSFHM